MATYSQEVIRLAQQVEKTYNVPASVTLAAFQYESGGGTSALAKNNNNYFGITGKGTAGSTVGTSHTWAKYNSMEESFNHFGRLLSSSSYANLTKNANNVEEYVKAYAERYAPSSDGNNNYAGNMISIINRDNLKQYSNWKNTNHMSGTPLTGTGVVGSSDIDIDPAGILPDKEKIIESVCLFTVLLLLAVASLYFLMRTFDVDVKKTAAKFALDKVTAGNGDKILEGATE